MSLKYEPASETGFVGRDAARELLALSHTVWSRQIGIQFPGVWVQIRQLLEWTRSVNPSGTELELVQASGGSAS